MTAHARKFPVTSVIAYAVLLVGAAAVIYPFLVMVMNSFKPGSELLNSQDLFPSTFTLTGYTGVFQQLDVLRLFRNSLLLAAPITILNTLLSALAGYAFAKIPFPGGIRRSASCWRR